MSTLRSERELDDMTDRHDMGRDHEISLGTTTLLGIFFALALVCAGFFGFGYTLGRKSVQAASVAATVPADASLSESFKTFKPAPGNPAGGIAVKDTGAAYTPPGGAAGAPVVTGKALDVAPVKKPGFDPDAEIVTSDTPVKAPAVARPTPVAAAPVAVAGGTTLVQVSAFRRREDADTVVSALRRKGYTVFIRNEPQDSLLHVQLGPYATKKDAQAMMEKLSADGFNAMLK